jgi:hypothetical protein
VNRFVQKIAAQVLRQQCGRFVPPGRLDFEGVHYDIVEIAGELPSECLVLDNCTWTKNLIF